MFALFSINLCWIVRDRIFQAVIAVFFLLVMLVPVLSSFSMRQSQELSVTLSLSAISFVLLVYSLLLGSTLVWREIERKYVYSVLSLPTDRGMFLFAKFASVAWFLFLTGLLLGACASAGIALTSFRYPSPTPVQWGVVFLAILFDVLKYTMLAAIGILVSTIATSFFMPFFTTLAIFLAGSASQDVYEFINSANGSKMPAVALYAVKFVYFVIPNFAAFDFKLQAVYPVPVDTVHLLYAAAYFLIYTILVLALAMWNFQRRELT